MKKLCVLLLGFSLIALSSCGDDNGPEITITSPADGSTFAAGGTIVVTGTATDDVGVTSIDVSGKDGFNLSGSLDLSQISDLSNIPFSFDVNLDSTSVAGDYTLIVTATDGDGNVDDAELDFTIQ